MSHPARLPLVVAVIAAASTAAIAYEQLPHWDRLWHSPIHDRNAHLEAGLGLALDLSHGRATGLVTAIDRARTWPPLHDVFLVAGSVLLGGNDARWAVLPSLLSLVGAAVFAALAARRMVGESSAGYVAALFVLASPAFRAYAFDVMLENVGACLTLAVLAAWLAACQDQTPVAWRRLALALSALFFAKYNYWLLALLAILVVEAPAALPFVRPALEPLRHAFIPWLSRQWRHPLNYVILALAGLACWVRCAPGGAEATLFGRTFALRSNANLATLLYWVILLRASGWLWRTAWPARRRDPRLAAVVERHLLPVALWFLWPQKLAVFLWYLNPKENGELPVHDNGGYAFYAHAIGAEYHWALWSTAGAAALAVLGFAALLRGRLRPGSSAVFALLVLAALLTANHPNRKSRFVHNWLPALWVATGAGAGTLARLRPAVSRRAVAAACGALYLAHLPALWSVGAATEGGVPSFDCPSALPLVDAYLPHLADCQRPAVLSNVPMKFFFRWTYLERYTRGARPLFEIPGYNQARACPENTAAFRSWIDSTNCDAIVLADVPPDSPWYSAAPGFQGLEQIAALLPQQERFHRLDTTLPGVTVWRR